MIGISDKHTSWLLLYIITVTVLTFKLSVCYRLNANGSSKHTTLFGSIKVAHIFFPVDDKFNAGSVDFYGVTLRSLATIMVLQKFFYIYLIKFTQKLDLLNVHQYLCNNTYHLKNTE